MDNYIYRNLLPNGTVVVDVDNELFKINYLDEYKFDHSDYED
jgi:hypothetical protein